MSICKESQRPTRSDRLCQCAYFVWVREGRGLLIKPSNEYNLRVFNVKNSHVSKLSAPLSFSMPSILIFRASGRSSAYGWLTCWQLWWGRVTTSKRVRRRRNDRLISWSCWNECKKKGNDASRPPSVRDGFNDRKRHYQGRCWYPDVVGMSSSNKDARHDFQACAITPTTGNATTKDVVDILSYIKE